MAHAEGLTDDQAHALAREGKAVVWIDGGLHASETVGSQQLMEMVYQMASRTDPETMRLLDDVIQLYVQANPDGQEMVANWYMREKDPLKRNLNGMPMLYAKYVGHDDNRDFYMSAMKETTNMNRQLFLEWYPQIMYNHHQTGPAGAVIFMPPFRDPFNYNFDPLVPLGIELVGTAMHSRLVAEGKGGSAMRTGANYSTWWNGGLRTVTYFHNMIGILTEIIGNPTPIDIPLVAEKQLPQGDWPLPIAPTTNGQKWHYRQSIEYEMSNNRAILDLASQYRETFLYNIYQMGRNSIQKGSQDTWTTTPKRIAAMEEAAAKMAPAGGRGGRGGRGGGAAGGGLPAGLTQGGAGAATIPSELYNTVLHDPKMRDPRGYIIPSDQADFATATEFVERAAQERHHHIEGHGAILGGGQELSVGILRRENGAGVPAARHGYVRAAGSSQRFRVSGRTSEAALRHHRLDAGISNGREVRSHSRRLRRPVREDQRPAASAAGAGDGYRDRGLSDQPSHQQFVRADQPPAQSRRRRVLDQEGSERGRRGLGHRSHLGARGSRARNHRSRRKAARRARASGGQGPLG